MNQSCYGVSLGLVNQREVLGAAGVTFGHILVFESPKYIGVW